jgi:steroid delta-isomerase-like uncharacterized protein
MYLIFEDETGRQVDFDLRGSVAEVLERALPTKVRGRGRPRLGVVSREVTLLPRHWSWLQRQPKGLSASLRRLVEQAMKDQSGAERARQIRAALSSFLSCMAGDRPNYEEACRALFAGELDRFESLIRSWPKDIRSYAQSRAREAARVEEPGSGEELVAELYERIWSRGEYDAIERLVAPRYTIHRDPGDAWEGQTLDRDEYRERVGYSRTAFPDLVFTLHELVGAGERVSVRWSAVGTQLGDLDGLPATGKKLSFEGQTIYELRGGRIAGHWQVVDRLGFIQQLRPQ